MENKNYPITKILIFLNFLVMLIVLTANFINHQNISLANDTLLNFGAILPRESSLWTIVSAMFLHVGFFHIVMNMLSLKMIGKEVEPILGKLFLPFYLLTGFISGLAVYLISDSATVGASGAICGIWGASLVNIFKHEEFASKRKAEILDIIILIGIGFLPNVSGIGHFFGLASGVVLSLIIFNFIKKDVSENNFIEYEEEPKIIVVEGYRLKKQGNLIV